MAYELENIAIRNIKCVDYSCVIWNITKYDAINWSYNSELHIMAQHFITIKHR